MKVVVISDTHGQHDLLSGKIPKCDILIHCGDISSVGRVEQVGAFLYWFDKQPARYKILISGNHDWLFQTQNSLARSMVIEYENMIYLQDSEIIIDSVKIYGTPWQPEFCQWAFNLPRGPSLREKWNLISEDIDILLTHGAPYKILDKTVDKDLTGCIDLLDRVQEVKPRFHFFGHIHEAYGHIKIGKTNFYNCSSCDERYRMVNPPVILNIKPKK